MASRMSGKRRMIMCLCFTILGLLIVGGVCVFITWLVLRPHEPRYYVEHASYPELSFTDKILNSRMVLNLTTRNPNRRIGIYYYKMEGYIYYGHQRIAGADIGPFYQGHKVVRVLQPTFTAHSVILNGDSARDLKLENSAGTLQLKLKLYAQVRFKVGRWKSRHYHMKVKCDNLNVDKNKGGNSFDHRKCSVHF